MHGLRLPFLLLLLVGDLQILRPSVIVKISYFTVNSMSLVGTSFEWQRNAAAGGESPPALDPKHLGERAGRGAGVR